MKKNILFLLFLLVCSGKGSVYAQTTEPERVADSLQNRYPVQKTLLQQRSDLDKQSPVDLRTPSNIRTEIVYDAKTDRYIFQNKIGETVIGKPFYMTPQEYMKYRASQTQTSYFRTLNAFTADSSAREQKQPFSLSNMRLNTGVLEDIFGRGGLQITTQGSVEVSSGLKRSVTNNPTLPERARKRNTFNFDQDIQLNVNAKLGEKINFGLNYNTDASFDFDSKRIKLAYQGDEDEIIKNIEAGNVSMTTTNSLINGGAALFGIKTDLQFGKLHVNTIFSQQESESSRVHSNGNIQTTPFELRADEYDENRHFFLGYYFREAFDRAMSKLPYVSSSVSITKMEVWVTNKTSNFEQARNIIAFADLGEHDIIHNPMWSAQGSAGVTYNDANNLYAQLISTYSAVRDIRRANTVFPGAIVQGQDYEKIENARLLSPSEYTYQPQLGYLSLRSALQADEVLAVAFEFTYNGQAYQVGEFSSDITDGSAGTGASQSGALFLKLLKPVSLSPVSYTWDLMMKNIYSVGYNAYNLQSAGFKMNITYQSDTTGVYLNYIPEGNIRNDLLLRVMNLDRLNSKNDPYPDGIFDFLDGYTVSAQNGRIIFPVVEPFGSHLRRKIADDALADKYVYQELYDSTLTVARQLSEKNKFRISGEYRGTSGSGISLNATNVTPGSVRVTAAGVTLTEGSDYTVDYMTGTVNILNQSLLDAGTPISVSLENQSLASMQRKTMMGINLLYDYSKNLSIGGTLMHFYEKPLTTKTVLGDESVKNTLWGLNASYKKESYLLTNLLDLLPFVNATAPSHISANAEFAHMIPGHYRNKYTGGYSYLDDFETSTSGIDLRSPYAWTLAATPYNNTSTGLFPEAALSNNIEYTKNRALMSWFYIDGLFTQRNSSRTPAHIKNDDEQLSNHLVREVYEREIYPNKDPIYGQASTIPVLNISYYPNERGPYNLDTEVDSDGHLLNAYRRWGGITRKIDTRDFEAANIEYIEFWLMDPFVNDTLQTAQGGDLYFNLGEISEDVLKDGRKFFENGLPVDGDTAAIGYSVWGKYPERQSTVYAFDQSQGMNSRRIQDVGLNGLNTEEEKTYPTYASYLETYRSRLSGDAIARLQEDAHSPLNDPAGDNFRHYRGPEQDRQQLSILERYKYFNGTEGNSLAPEEDAGYSTASRTTPDVEDIDNDNTMNESESYYQYKVKLRPGEMAVGSNFIVDKRSVSVALRNGQSSTVNWYQFKVPIKEYETRVGNIRGFNNIRFMRMFLTGFEDPVFLRFATLELVRSEWRTYTQDLASGGAVSGTGSLELSTVNIEENGDRTPVNYVLPPGVTRITDPSQPQLRQENEQSISLKIRDLDAGDSRAVYKSALYDLRRYKRLQLFVHAEELEEDPETLEDGELTVFLRLGSDYRNNYYEYEIPLDITPEGRYNGNVTADREKVWMPGNLFDFPLKALTNLKLERNTQKNLGNGVTYLTPYTVQDPDKSDNTMTIVGNPSLAEVKVMMIGVRNRTDKNKSGEVWVNELRLSEFDEDGGWAAQGNVNLSLSDIGAVNISGRKETAGFGALDQSLLERRNDDYASIDFALNLELGRFFPEKAKVTAPFYYSYSSQTNTPKYDPLNQDILLSESFNGTNSRTEKDSIINFAMTRTTTKSLSLSNVKVDIKSKTPMPYDPANFSFGYSYNENKHQDPETEYATMQDFRLQASYAYTPFVKPWEPFKHLESKSGWLKLIKSLNLNYLPNTLQASSYIVRNYSETQLRDLNAYLAGMTETQTQYLSFSQNFEWNRNFSIAWDLTRNLKTSFRSGTIAEIEEPYLQVNKKINRNDYEIWKDSVTQSIQNLGKPLSHEQTADVTYTLPFAQIPILDWIHSSAAYNSRYRWERGAYIEDVTIGNYLQNELSLTLNNRFNLVSFYNKIPFLQQTNRYFDGDAGTPKALDAAPEPEERTATQTVRLQTDSNTIVTHNLNSKNLRITARRNGKQYVLRHKKLDNNRIALLNRDTVDVEVVVRTITLPPREPAGFDIARYAARGLMMLRSLNVNIAYKTRTDLPGFNPMIGDFFGQSNSAGTMIPGLGFAFGLEGGGQYIEKALRNDWLVINPENISPAVYNVTTNVRMDAVIEPFRGLKIDLNALYEDNRRTEFQYMVEGQPQLRGGSFAMTTVSLASAFEGSSAANNYRSATFDAFLSNKDIISARWRNRYTGSTYPNAGFIAQTGLGGQSFDPSVADINPNSADVLIPAFLAAYTGKNPNNVGLTAFPDITSLLPNWNISFNPLSTFLPLRDLFQSLVFTHKYISQYRVGAYTSFLSRVSSADGSGLGYVRDVLTGLPVPSSPYDISSVNLIESFSPLIEARGVFNNNLSLNLRWNKTRTVNLNIASYQIVETSDNDWVFGLGYRIPDFNRVLGINLRENNRRRTPRRRRTDTEASNAASNTASTFSNDLNIRFDVSHKTTHALIRKIEDGFSQATSGLRTTTIQFSADYDLSRALTLRAFFDKAINTPLISSTSYPTSETDAGLSLRFNLNQ